MLCNVTLLRMLPPILPIYICGTEHFCAIDTFDPVKCEQVNTIGKAERRDRRATQQASVHCHFDGNQMQTCADTVAHETRDEAATCIASRRRTLLLFIGVHRGAIIIFLSRRQMQKPYAQRAYTTTTKRNDSGTNMRDSKMICLYTKYYTWITLSLSPLSLFVPASLSSSSCNIDGIAWKQFDMLLQLTYIIHNTHTQVQAAQNMSARDSWDRTTQVAACCISTDVHLNRNCMSDTFK